VRRCRRTFPIGIGLWFGEIYGLPWPNVNKSLAWIFLQNKSNSFMPHEKTLTLIALLNWKTNFAMM